MTDQTTVDTTATQAEAKPVLTRAEKYAARVVTLEKRIAKDTEDLAALRIEIETSTKLDSVVAGTAIVARIGRADTSKEVAARVQGVKEDESGSRRYKIVFGEGFDVETVVIQPAQIIQVIAE